LLSIGGKCPGADAEVLVIRSAPDRVAGCVSSELTGVVAQATSALRDEAPFSLRVDEIERLLIERDGKKLELARTEKGFQLRLPELAEVGLAEGNRRLADLLLANGELSSLPNLAVLGLSPPRGTVKLWSTVIEGVARFEETLMIGREQADGRLAVRRAEDGAVLLLSRDAARAYTPDSTLLRSAQIFDFGPSDLEQLSVDSKGVRQLIRRTSSAGFELIEPAGFELDSALALELVQALGTLEAERWVSSANETSFGLESPTATLTLRFAARDTGPKTEVLRIGKHTSDGAFAKLDSSASVFLVPKSVADQSLRLLLSRSVFGSDRAKLEQVRLERRGQKFGIERQGGGFVNTESARLLASSIERVVEAVSSLRAEAALHMGPARPEEGFDSGVVVQLHTDAPKAKVIRIGAADNYRDMKVSYARVDGIDATYVVPHSSVRPILDLF
jgi:hypothetical protein